METHHRRLLGRRHIVEFVAGLLREITIDVERDVPIRILQEQLGNVGYVGLNQDFRIP